MLQSNLYESKSFWLLSNFIIDIQYTTEHVHGGKDVAPWLPYVPEVIMNMHKGQHHVGSRLDNMNGHGPW